MPKTNICQYWPPWFRRILDFQALCQTEGVELDALAGAIERVRDNLFVQTMDEGTTAQWEGILRILPSPSDTLEFRRLRVLNRIALRPPFTLTFLYQKMDLLFGPGNWSVAVDYPEYTLYISADAALKDRFTELSALLNIIKPCHIVYVCCPRIPTDILLSEELSRGRVEYNYIQGAWKLGEKPFVTYSELEVLKMPGQPSIQRALLEQTSGFVAGDVEAARINGSILITTLSRLTNGNVGSVIYPVQQAQTTRITLAELLDKNGVVLASCAVDLPVAEPTVSMCHTFTVKEGI